MLDGLAAVFLKLPQAEIAFGDQVRSLFDEFGIQSPEIEVTVADHWRLKIVALDEL